MGNYFLSLIFIVITKVELLLSGGGGPFFVSVLNQLKTPDDKLATQTSTSKSVLNFDDFVILATRKPIEASLAIELSNRKAQSCYTLRCKAIEQGIALINNKSYGSE